MRLLQVYDAQQGGRAEEAAELRADPQVLSKFALTVDIRSAPSVVLVLYFRLSWE